MTTRSISRVLLIVSCLTILTVHAKADDPPVRRLRGVVDRNDTWFGHIMITDHLKILDATVTVRPGTVIEFALARPGEYPTLTVGSQDDGGELLFQGTKDRPIIVRSRPGTNAGRLIVYLRDRITTALPLRPSKKGESKSADVGWQHIRFENVGSNPPRPSPSYTRYKPAVTFHFVGPSHSLNISDCSFDNSTRLKIIADDASGIVVEDNRFENPNDRVSLEIDGSQIDEKPGSIGVFRNRAAAAIVVGDAQAEVKGNILIGLNASIIVSGDDARTTQVNGNYVHNTTQADDGRYCFNTEIPEIIVGDNIFRGGTTCVFNGSTSMYGNVFIGEPDLSRENVKQSQTHQLVAALPPKAIFKRNLLLGPAHSLLIPQPTRTYPGQGVSDPSIHIFSNVFDGFGKSSRAIHVNPADRLSTKILVASNLFLRVPSLIYDEAASGTSVGFADGNACAPLPARAFENVSIPKKKKGDAGWSSKDVMRKDISELRLSESPPIRIPDYDRDVQSGRLSIEKLRQQLFDIYRPLPNSPLVGAGCGIVEGPPQTIGAAEPAGASSESP